MNPWSQRSLATAADTNEDSQPEDIQIEGQGHNNELPDPETIGPCSLLHESVDDPPLEWPIELSSAVGASSLETASFHEIEENDEEHVFRMTLDYDPRVRYDDDIWHRRYGVNVKEVAFHCS